jgi:FKBP-type peptidyl-prolyl cis-trans isomerase FklB
MRRIFWIIFISFLILVSCRNKRTVDVGIRTRLDTISYSIGIVYGQNLHGDGFDTINPWVIARAFDDLLDEKELLISKEDAKSILLEQYARVKKGQLLSKFEDVKIEGEKFLEENSRKDGVVVLPSGLQYKVLKKGKGMSPDENDLVRVFYKGSFINGEVFDKHVEGDPIVYGVNRVIKGWSEALQLMKPGSRWRLFIPYELGYGEEFRPNSDIVPYSALIFDLELVSVDSREK